MYLRELYNNKKKKDIETVDIFIPEYKILILTIRTNCGETC